MISFLNIKKGYVIDNKNNYKDFLSSNQFSKIIKILISKKFTVFNVSIGRKVCLNDIIRWLNFYNNKNNSKVTENLSQEIFT